MEDYIQRLARLAEKRHIRTAPENFDLYVRAMDAAVQCVTAESDATGIELSETEKEAAEAKCFRIEAAKLGMSEAEIEGRLYMHIESMKIVSEMMKAA